MEFLGLRVDNATMGDSHVLVASGDIDQDSTRLLDRVLEATPPDADVAVDLAEVAFIDSAGLGTLLRHSQRLAEFGGSLHLRNPSPEVQRLLDLTRLDSLLG